MPIVKESQESGGAGWEDVVVTFKEVADGLMKNDEMRVIYEAGDRTFSLGVDPKDPAGNLVGFAVGNPPAGEAALRQFIAQNAVREPVAVKAKDNFIQFRACPLGPNDGDATYEGRLAFIYTGTRPDFNNPAETQHRVSMAFYTDEGERATVNDPTPVLLTKVGQTPEEDVIDGELNRDKAFWTHAIACGLDWTRFLEEMREADALWPGHYDSNMKPLPSYFTSADPAEWPLDVMGVIERHGGPFRVRWTMTKHEKGYPTLKRNKSKIIILETITQQMSAEDEDWLDWRTRFADTMDLLVGQAFGDDRLTFVNRADWYLTDKGKETAVHMIKPIYELWPNIAPPEGITTRIRSPKNWNTDLFIAVQHVADALLKSQKAEYELAVSGLVGEGRAEELVAWLDANPEAKHYLEFGEAKL